MRGKAEIKPSKASTQNFAKMMAKLDAQQKAEKKNQKPGTAK
jgi:hypothetical protein